MNWHIETTGDKLKEAKPDIQHGEHETATTKPKPKLLTAARNAADKLATELGGDTLVTIDAHDTTEGEGFRPGHVTVTVSRVDPAAKSD